ncbi:MAG: diacylglycerol kinase [Thiomonas sp. 15-66-11]|nr:MAG: diacylglycerol kinase [Thiomonas sp. 15-66-11]
MRHGLPGSLHLSPHPYKNKTGLARLAQAVRNSASGIRTAWRTESAFRQESLLTLVMLPLAFWLGNDGTERALLAGSVVLVLVVELLNTAVEYTVDRVSLERHDLSKTAKDLGSAAVLLTLLLCALVWLAILLPRFS